MPAIMNEEQKKKAAEKIKGIKGNGGFRGIRMPSEEKTASIIKDAEKSCSEQNTNM